MQAEQLADEIASLSGRCSLESDREVCIKAAAILRSAPLTTAPASPSSALSGEDGEVVAWAYYHDGQNDDVDHPIVSRIRKSGAMRHEPWTEVALVRASPTPAAPDPAALRTAVLGIITSAMAWQPSENGPSYGTVRDELVVRFDALLTQASPNREEAADTEAVREALEDCVALLRGNISGAAQRDCILRAADSVLARVSLNRKEAIPSGVYFNLEAENFYNAETKKGCGIEFYRKWRPIAAHFPSAAEEALSTSAPAQAEEGWQDISTAPHETYVLLGWWDEGKWNSATGFASHGWRRDGISTMSWHGQATHWRPLPAHPRALTSSSGGEQ